MKGKPAIRFSELSVMTGVVENHKSMRERWHRLLIDAEVFGEPALMSRFVAALEALRDDLYDSGETIEWDALIIGAVKRTVPKHWIVCS